MSKRKYGLFKVTVKENGKKSYERLYDSLSFPKSVAVRVFQNALLASAMGYVNETRELRPLPKES